jgi:two-component system chemotaxis response regulator CheB
MRPASTAPIRVLILDDSALIRQMLTEILASDPGIEVVGSAPDPYVARDKIKVLNPDVLTLDIELPRMDGLSFLEKLMTLRPMPVVVVSTLTQKGADAALRALELGAVDYVPKPLSDIRHGVSALAPELIAKVKTAASARVTTLHKGGAVSVPAVFDHRLSSEGTIVAVGASTGGVETLQRFVAWPAGGYPSDAGDAAHAAWIYRDLRAAPRQCLRDVGERGR